MMPEKEWDSTSTEHWAKESTPFSFCHLVSWGHLQREDVISLCHQCLSLEFSIHWLFDFKAICIPSQSVLKIGFLTKNSTGITHLTCHVLVSHNIATPPAGGVRCSNHPQLCASVSRFWNFAILWKLPLFFLSCANTVQWLISFHILGAHLFARLYTDNPIKWEKHTGDTSVPLSPPCNSGQSADLS